MWRGGSIPTYGWLIARNFGQTHPVVTDAPPQGEAYKACAVSPTRMSTNHETGQRSDGRRPDASLKVGDGVRLVHGSTVSGRPKHVRRETRRLEKPVSIIPTGEFIWGTLLQLCTRGRDRDAYAYRQTGTQPTPR